MKDIIQAVENNRKLIKDAESYIWANPETGFKEYKTSKYMAEQFTALGYDLVMADGITGFYTVLDTGREGPEILILGELDSIICSAHPESDPVTGAVHSCGHHAQCAALLGIAAALKDEKVLSKMCGKIRLCAVPAEELLEIEYRSELIKQGKIKYMGGKTEYMARGYFDGVDMAFMVHTNYSPSINLGSVGMVAKKVIYKGKAAHAGGSPWLGKNALYAANCGLNAVNALRETFREEDLIRWHPIITAGGDMVNAIPEIVKVESYVRGKTLKAIKQENKKINNALIGSAISFGMNIEIEDKPGYAPLTNDINMIKLAEDAFNELMPDNKIEIKQRVGTGSTDMGDLSCVMPVVHPYCGGAAGTEHGRDYKIADFDAACMFSAKWQLVMLKLLTENGAERAKKIISEFKPTFNSIKEYLEHQDSLNASGERLEYDKDGNATII